MGFLSGLFGSSNKSTSSSSSTVTNQTDASVTGGNDSVNVSVTGAGSSVQLTDRGAVHDSLELAKLGVEKVTKLAETQANSTGDLLGGALRMVGEQQQQFTSAIENIKGNDVRTLVLVGIAVVGLAAVQLFKAKG